MSAPVLIMAGGTGGHIFPGIAVGHELQRRGVPVVWLGARTGLEQQLVPAAGFPLETLDFAAVRGKGAMTLLLAPLRLLRSVWAARAILRRVKPRSVLSMGGYAAAPGGIATWLRGTPLVVHEQNRIAGLTNRLLSRLARRVLGGFAGSLANVEWVGNPVRESISAVTPPAQRLPGRDGPLRVLVLGGSQGARSLNQALPAVLSHCAGERALSVRHQCGQRHVEATTQAYREAGFEAEVSAFIDDMADAYAWADVVVCRAGALTVAELCAVGVAAVLVPFPLAVDDHQTRNAEVLVDAGAARLVAEGEGFEARLQQAFTEISADRARLLDMAGRARGLARPEATQRIADICLEVCE